MIAAADRATGQTAQQAKLLVVDGDGHISHARRQRLADHFQPGDLVIANDAATLPASLNGRHVPTGEPIEVRLTARRSLAPDDVHCFSAVLFGAGDFRTPTERRPLPPALFPGDRLALGPLAATVVQLLGHPRLARLRFDGASDAIWAGLSRHGRPIQYAHVGSPLALWDVWTAIAGPPVAFEPPSAGFALDWGTLGALRARRIEFATITHAAGISSTGDDELDAYLPFDEPYDIPQATATAIAGARARGARIVAIGTTVVRALEHAALPDGQVRTGAGLATQRIGPDSTLRVVDAILTGIHEPGTSHYQLLRAFVDDATLARAILEARAFAYRTHEFGDFALIESRRHTQRPPGPERQPPCNAALSPSRCVGRIWLWGNAHAPCDQGELRC